ncbi:MAG: MAPEG family protein [Rhizobiales bacterium]|nr:MAPEG family protein [Hyphomicrobiales bacterium]NRB13866.1 MAPEG family protein [Hyphomicrobiales bacterium]
MTFWILAALALYIVQLLSAPGLRYITGGIKQIAYGLGAHDKPAKSSVIDARLSRAAENMKESMPIFLALALLAEMNGISSGLAVQGAMVFVLARLVYIPAYVSAVFGLRSLVWTIAMGGMVMMLVGIWPSLAL